MKPRAAERKRLALELASMFLATLKTFGVWSSLGAGLLLSGFFSVEAIRELRGDPRSENFLMLIGVFVVGGGIFIGLLALVVRRLIESPHARMGALPRGQALLEYAASLGVTLQHTHDGDGNLLEADLQHRILEVEKAVRERRAFSIAIGAALVSALSALAAWYTHLK